MKYFGLILLISLVTFLSCSEPKKNKFEPFTKKEPQQNTERDAYKVTTRDSLNLTEKFGDIAILDIKFYEGNLYLQISGKNFLVLNADNFNQVNKISIPEGRGPGELLALRSFDLENGTLAILDGDAMKTALYDPEGNFREEFLNDEYPVEAIEIADANTFFYQVKPAYEFLFIETDREDTIRHRFQKQMQDINRMATTGEMVYHNNSIYFGGYSEPILRRYDISDTGVEPVFSRGVIDSYNSEKNYVERETSGGSRLWTYSDVARYASKDIAVDDNYIYSARHHNDKVGYKFLDIYSNENGDYLGSIEVKYYPYLVAVGNVIYTVESESGESHLIKYPKLQFYSGQ